MARIIIVGGGITGLSAAFRLSESIPGAGITLLEATERLGGKVLTDRPDGFVIEGGPDSFLTAKPRGVGLATELGIANRLQSTRQETRGAYVLGRGRLHRLPEGLTGLVPSRLEPLLQSELLSEDGKRRLKQEVEIPAQESDRDESIAQFITRRFGREVYDRLVEPLMAGIYAGDGEQLSLAATFPLLQSIERAHGSVIRGIEATASPALGSAGRSAFVAPIGGMIELVAALEARLDGVQIRCSTAVRRIRSHGHGLRVTVTGGEQAEADAVILAVPAHVAAEILSDIAPVASSVLTEIQYVSTATVALAYRERDLPDIPIGHGYVIPRVEGRPALASTWVSQKFSRRAPAGHALLRVFVGRAGQPDPLTRTDADLTDLARVELRNTLGIDVRPTLARVSRWPRAMPQYTLGHLQRLGTIENELRATPGLFLAGALRGVGMPDCIRSGESAADAVSAFVDKAPRTDR